MHKHDNAILICKWRMVWANSVIRFFCVWVSRKPVHAHPVKGKQDILFTMMLLQTHNELLFTQLAFHKAADSTWLVLWHFSKKNLSTGKAVYLHMLLPLFQWPILCRYYANQAAEIIINPISCRKEVCLSHGIALHQYI